MKTITLDVKIQSTLPYFQFISIYSLLKHRSSNRTQSSLQKLRVRKHGKYKIDFTKGSPLIERSFHLAPANG